MKKQQHSRILFMTELAVLIAVLLLLEITGLGMFKTFGLELTILQVPVIVGAILLGPNGGAILGAVFGLISFFECFGKSAFGAALLAIHPFFTFLVCVPTRTMMGWLCGLTFRAFDKSGRAGKGIVPFALSSLIGALLNTILFMGTLCLCFYQTDLIRDIVTSLGASNPLTFIVLFVGIQGLVEALLCTVLGGAIAKGVYHALHRKHLQAQ